MKYKLFLSTFMEDSKMSLEDFAKSLVASNNFIKASFGGFAGAGKTRTATEFIIGAYKLMNLKKPVLIIDNEKGSRFLVPIFKKAGIETLVKDTIYLSDVIQAFDYLKSGEIDFLFIDSLTKVWYNFINQYKQKVKKPFLTLQDWGKILPEWQQQFSDKFVEIIGNCVFTGRGGFTYDMEENEETHKKEFVKSGVKMKLAGETPFEPDINVWMDLEQEMNDGTPTLWRTAQIMKDRSGIIDGKTFKNPTFKDFEPVVKFLLNVEKGEVCGASDKSNTIPTEEYSNKKQLKEIEIEKIQNIFIENGFSTDNQSKKYKIAIMQKIAGTSSAKEVEMFSIEKLNSVRIELDAFFLFWGDADDKEKYIIDYKIEDNLFKD